MLFPGRSWNPPWCALPTGWLRDLAGPSYSVLALTIHGQCSIRSSPKGSFRPSCWPRGAPADAAALVGPRLPTHPQLQVAACLGGDRARNAAIEVDSVLLITQTMPQQKFSCTRITLNVGNTTILWDSPRRQEDIGSLAFPSSGLFYPKPWRKAFSVHSSYTLLKKRAWEQPPAPKPSTSLAACSLCSTPFSAKPFYISFEVFWLLK